DLLTNAPSGIRPLANSHQSDRRRGPIGPFGQNSHAPSFVRRYLGLLAPSRRDEIFRGESREGLHVISSLQGAWIRTASATHTPLKLLNRNILVPRHPCLQFVQDGSAIFGAAAQQ